MGPVRLLLSQGKLLDPHLSHLALPARKLQANHEVLTEVGSSFLLA